MISTVVLTKNEEKNIIDCLRTLDWCDEIIIVDDYSTDKTIELIEKSGNKKIKIYKHHLSDDFSSQRNFGLEKAKGDWILFIDADEMITVSLQYEILNVINTQIGQLDAYYIRRRDNMWGKILQHGETANVKLLRLSKRGIGKWEGKVHEVWQIKGKVGFLKNPLIHHPHSETANFLSEINFYTDLRAEELFHNRVKVYWWSILLYPFSKFFMNYFVSGGILDGTPGIIHAVIMSFHSFLVRGKLWSLWERERT